MKVVFYVLECMDYEYLMSCNAPVIKSLKPHPAYSYGATTAAAVHALLTGYTPTCAASPQCPHTQRPRKMIPPEPFFLKKFKQLFLYIPNGWVFQFVQPYMKNLMPRLLEWHKVFNTKAMVEDFISRSKSDDYFAYFQVMETHPPFLEGLKEVKPSSPEWDARRRKAVEIADKCLELLLSVDYDLLVVCADHNIRHDFAHPDGYKVFIATDPFP